MIPNSDNLPPQPKNWGDVFSPDVTAMPTWANMGGLENRGDVRAVIPTPDGGGIWMQGGYGWQFWRLFPNGDLHRYTRQTDGSLREYRIETVQGAVLYTSPDPFSGSTKGDLAMRQARGKKPFHVTAQATVAISVRDWKTCNVTWFYDDTGGVSFGILDDGSVAVYDLNLTPDGPGAEKDGIFIYGGRGGTQVMEVPFAVQYGGKVLPQSVRIDGFTSRWAFNERSIPYTIPSTYFKNLNLSDEKILEMSPAALASIYYTILSPKMQGNCPHYIPNDTVSQGMSEVQAYCNEMDIRLRIYTLRPDMHFVLNAAGQKVIGLVDPLKIPIYNGMRCKESLIATIGLSVAIGLVTMGAGAILPILGTLADLAQFGASVSDLFAAQEGMQKMIDFQTQVKTGVAGLLQQTTPSSPVPPPPPAPPTPVRSTTPTVGVVAAVPAGGSHPAGGVADSKPNNSLAFWVVAILLFL